MKAVPMICAMYAFGLTSIVQADPLSIIQKGALMKNYYKAGLWKAKFAETLMSGFGDCHNQTGVRPQLSHLIVGRVLHLTMTLFMAA